MSLNNSVVSGKCWRCAELKAQLKDTQERLEQLLKEVMQVQGDLRHFYGTANARLNSIILKINAAQKRRGVDK